MIYDLSTLYDREFSEGSLETAALIAIAERLDALREAVGESRNPSLVMLTAVRSNGDESEWLVNANFVSQVFWFNGKAAVATKHDRDGEFTLVKGTVAEITAKLRGEE